MRASRPLSPRPAQGSSAQASISLGDAGAAGGLEVVAKPSRLLRGGERTDQGAIVGALGAQIGAANDRLMAAELIGKFGPKLPERGLGLGFGALRCDLHGVATAGGRGGVDPRYR